MKNKAFMQQAILNVAGISEIHVVEKWRNQYFNDIGQILADFVLARKVTFFVEFLFNVEFISI